MLELNKQETLEILESLQDGPLKDKVRKFYNSQQEHANRIAERENKQKAMDTAGLCTFDEAWRGRCGKKGYPYCPEHSKERCRKCGAQATHSCAETFQFVCGEPLCDRHNHNSISEVDVQWAIKRQREDDLRRYGKLQEDK